MYILNHVYGNSEECASYKYHVIMSVQIYQECALSKLSSLCIVMSVVTIIILSHFLVCMI